MRPKLLKLQAEERQAEDAATPTPITPLSGGILQFPLSKPVVPITVAPTPLTGGFPAPQIVGPVADSPGPTSLPEPSLQSTNDSTEWNALLALVNSLPLNPQAPDQAPVVEAEEPMPSGEADLVESPKSFDSGEDSLFGGDTPVSLFGDDSPVDKNYEAPAHLVSTQEEEEEVAEPISSKKRKFEENSEVSRRASKRLRNCSLP